jgi:hypothetical protein
MVRKQKGKEKFEFYCIFFTDGQDTCNG